jgi:hypothetical protein
MMKARRVFFVWLAMATVLTASMVPFAAADDPPPPEQSACAHWDPFGCVSYVYCSVFCVVEKYFCMYYDPEAPECPDPN